MELGSFSTVDKRIWVISAMEAMVMETLLDAVKSLASLFMVSLLNDIAVSPDLTPTDKRFPLEELHKMKQPDPENQDGSDTEDDEEGDDDEDVEEPDDDAADEDFSGEEGGEDEGDPEDDPEANGDGESGDEDDEDDDGDDDDGGDEDGEEEEDEEEDEDEEVHQPPSKKRK